MNIDTIISTLNRILADRGVEITKWKEEQENERNNHKGTG